MVKEVAKQSMRNERVNSQSVLPLFLKSEIKEMSSRNMTADNTVVSPHYCSHTLLVALRAEASHALGSCHFIQKLINPSLNFLKVSENRSFCALHQGAKLVNVLEVAKQI